MQKLGFGFMRLPQINPDDYSSVDFDLTAKMVDAYFARGFNYFDTAYMYHSGNSEIAIRETVVKKYPRESFILADKLPIMSVKEDADLERIFNEQLERCGVDYFDIYHIHNLNVENYQLAEKFKAFDFVQQKKADGQARQIGFSYHDHADLLDEILTAHPETDYVQLQLNYLDWENEGIQSRKCYEVARRRGKKILAMEPLKGGTLAGGPNSMMPEQAQDLFKQYAPDLSVASWGIRYTASLEGVEMVLSGMSDMQQLEDNTSYMQHFKPLTEAEHGVVNEAVQLIQEAIAIPCTACQYCVDYCPMDIPIPRYFALYNNKKQSKVLMYSLQQLYYDNTIKEHGKASDCISCGACERQCPQQLKISELMKEVAATFEAAA